jgi:HPt (histidine-containing phosphotransfer) domain-containing protein
MRTPKLPIHHKQNLPECPAIDIDTLEQLRLLLGRDTPQIMAGLIENYLENAPRQLKKLRQALQGNNKEELIQAARALKAGSLTCGAIKLCALCDEIETKSPGHAAVKLTQIEMEYDRVKLIVDAEWRRLYELRLKTDVFFPTQSCRNIGFYPYSSIEQ